jgi:peptidoglycan hydrolase-like protein with peptidoglycan-binding domain
MHGKRSGFLVLALVAFFAFEGGALAQGAAPCSPAAAVIKLSIPAYKRMLKLGCRGADVKALQQKLKALGYFKGTADGVFGRNTQSSVKSFQKARKLKADGIVGRITYNAVYGAPVPAGAKTGGAAATATPAPTASPGYAFGKLNNQITLRNGSRGSNVKDLQAALKLKGFYSGAVNGSFQTTTRNAVMKFQRSVGLKADGKAGNYTLSALYTMLKPPDIKKILPWPAGVDAGLGIKIEKLNWSKASTVLKRNMTAKIVDVRTGYIFTVKRTGGTRHADVEPLTPLDTATFYKSAGNFSWARRPIWVIVGGRRLAASMNCMPHGYDTIAGNDFKGQFCIHFVGSRTHGTCRVDPDHQKCINEAYQKGLTMKPTPPPKASPSPTASPSASASPAA